MSLIVTGVLLVVGLSVLYMLASLFFAFIFVTGIAIILVSAGFSPLMSIIVGLIVICFMWVQPDSE